MKIKHILLTATILGLIISGGLGINSLRQSAPSEGGLVGYWTLAESDLYTAGIFQDMSGNGNNGTSANAPVYTKDQAGVPNQAMTFNGSTDYVTLGSSVVLDKDNASLSFWINPTLDSTDIIIGKSDDKYQSYIKLVDTGEVYGETNTNTDDFRSTTTISADVWTNVILVFDSGTYYFYFNGIQVSSGSVSDDLTFNWIGKSMDDYSAAIFDGSLSDIMIYSSALTADEVSKLYLAGRTTARVKVDACPTDMVYVGHDWTWQGTHWTQEYFCIDKYEASNGGGAYYVDMNGDGDTADTAVNVYGDGTTFNETTPTAKAVSVYNATPWVSINQVNAKAACMAAGKHLATNYEMLLAAKGTPDLGSGWGANDCQVNYNWDSQPGLTGSGSNCVSDAGAYDLIGNVWEWTDNVIVDNAHPATGASLPGTNLITGLDVYGLPTSTDGSGSDDYNYDKFWITVTGYRGFLRGGGWTGGSNAGLFALFLLYAPSSTNSALGFRCALTIPPAITPKLQKGLILDMPLNSLYTEAGGELSSGLLIVGHKYIITARTDGDFTAVGSPDNNVGTKFSASATGAGLLDAGDKVKELDGTTKDRTPYGNDGTVSGATIKYDGLVNAGAGIAYINQDKAYGTWEFDVNKGGADDILTIIFINDNIETFTSNKNSYYFQIYSNEALYFSRYSEGSEQSLFYTAASYIAINTDYRIKITRSLAGVFTVYIKGGTFGWDSWTTVSVAGGSGTNPVTDNTYTTSNYFIADLDNTDTISNLRIDSKRISLAKAVQSTGTWTLTGGAYDFTTDDYISITDTDLLSFGDGTDDSPFSVSAWVNMDDATDFKIASKGVYNTDGEWRLETAGDDKIAFNLFDESVASTLQYVYYNTPLTAYEGQWIHLVATYNGVGGVDAHDGMNIYIDGVLIDILRGVAGTYVAMENLTHDVWIGRYSTTYANGQISGLKIYNRELSSTEIEYLYSANKFKY